MPPKKQSAKAIAAEIKKRNTAQAQEIVSQLKLEMGKSGSDSVVKKPAVKKPEKSVTSDASKKRGSKDEDILAKSKRAKTSVQDKVLTVNTEAEATMKSGLNRAEIVEVGPPAEPAAKSETTKSTRSKPSVQDKVSTLNTEAKATMKSGVNRAERVEVGPPAKPAAKSETTKHVKTPPKSSESHDKTSSSKKSEKSSSSSKAADKKSARPPKANTSRSHGSGYQYEIDCKQVADSIDVKDLRVHLETHLKVDGKKNNLGSTVSILCEGHKVVVKSQTYLPKKSLRFLSKKFLKKNWNIRVLSKNAHSYEYKYVGAP